MTKKEFIEFAKQHNVTCKYSGNTKTMYLTGTNADIQKLKGHLVGTTLNYFINTSIG